MRAEAAEQLNDIIYEEAENDGITWDVLALRVRVFDAGVETEPHTSNALRYLLIDELGLGLHRSRDHHVRLEVTLPRRETP